METSGSSSQSVEIDTANYVMEISMDAVNGLDITDDSASEITAELQDYYTVSDGWLSTYTFSFGQAVDWSIKWGMPVYKRATNQMIFRPRSIA